jgi:predicted RNase H-like nuclease (RuvC/YqgF family)
MANKPKPIIEKRVNITIPNKYLINATQNGFTDIESYIDNLEKENKELKTKILNYKALIDRIKNESEINNYTKIIEYLKNEHYE